MFLCFSLSIWSLAFLKTCPDTALIRFIEAILKGGQVKIRLERRLQQGVKGAEKEAVEYSKTARHPEESILN